MPAKAIKKIAIIIPAYNEQEMIGNAVTSLKKITSSIKKLGYDLRIIVINDGSKDDTQHIAEAAGADLVVRHKVNRGLGAAIRSGLQAAFDEGADIAVKFDADLQHDPEDIIPLITPILNDEADIVYGKRFNRIEYRMPIIRRIGNLVFTGLMRYLTGWPLEDSQPGIFAVNRDYLKVFNLPGDYNYTQQVLLDAYYNGMRFAHVDVRFKKRETGKSFVNFRYPVKVGHQIILMLISFKPMKIFGTLGTIIILVGISVAGFEISQWLRGIAPKPVEHVNAVTVLLVLMHRTYRRR
jgi:glycosyltransferase involved in cell wall biosynthesis